MKNMLRFSVLMLLVCTMSSFSLNKRIPYAHYLGTVTVTLPNPANIEGTFKLYADADDPTVLFYILKPDHSSLIYVTGTYYPSAGYADIAKDGVYFYSGEVIN